MAIDYQELFADLGVVIKQINLQEQEQNTKITQEGEILAQYELSSQTEHTSNLNSIYNSMRSALTTGKSNQASQIITSRLTDRVTVVNELNIPSQNIGDVLFGLVEQMNLDSESVNASGHRTIKLAPLHSECPHPWNQEACPQDGRSWSLVGGSHGFLGCTDHQYAD